MGEMNLYTFGQILSNLTMEEVEASNHFIERARVRLNMDFESVL
jgi:hypothetical protein